MLIPNNLGFLQSNILYNIKLVSRFMMTEEITERKYLGNNISME